MSQKQCWGGRWQVWYHGIEARLCVHASQHIIRCFFGMRRHSARDARPGLICQVCQPLLCCCCAAWCACRLNGVMHEDVGAAKARCAEQQLADLMGVQEIGVADAVAVCCLAAGCEQMDACNMPPVLDQRCLQYQHLHLFITQVCRARQTRGALLCCSHPIAPSNMRDRCCHAALTPATLGRLASNFVQHAAP
jgi:hypothetical protein